ncbi:MAG: hypothetical protein ACYDBB_17580 [Armatimonadota bacterium]
MSTKWSLVLVVFLTLLATVLPVQAEMHIKKAAADKIFYEPGMTATFEVTIANPDGAPASATLKVELVSDVDIREKLTEQTLTIDAGKEFTWTKTRKLDPVMGMGLVATLSRGGAVLAAKEDIFSCARSVHQVMIHGYGNHGGWQFSGRIDKELDTYPKTFADQLRSTYGNYTEKFGWAPSDMDCLTPKEDRWWSGQTAYNESKTNMLAMIKAFHDQGIKVVTYGKASAGGVTGYELLRKYPERPGYTNGRPWLEGYNAAYLDYITALGPPHFGEMNMVPDCPEKMEAAGYKGAGKYQPYFGKDGVSIWCSVWYSFTTPEVQDVAIGELAGSAKMFGFDGVRFDGEFFAGRNQILDGSWNAPEKLDWDAANVALTKRMKDKCWAAKPGYLFGYNTGTDITWSIGKNNIPQTFREKCKDDGLVANEAYAFPSDIPWPDYLKQVRREAEIVRYYGGHYSTYAFNRNGNNLYNFIFQYGLRAHVQGAYTGSENQWVQRNATRFGKLLWDDSLTAWYDAPKSISVTGTRAVMWQEFAAVGAMPGGSRYIIHLYNPPDSTMTWSGDQLPKEPAHTVVVTWQNLAGVKNAYLVDMKKGIVEAIKPVDGIFQIGDIDFWKILVVDTTTPPSAAQYYEPPAGAKATGPSAADLQLTAQPTENKSAWRAVVEPESFGGGEATAARLPDADALNGGAVMGKPGNPPGGMSYTYEYPRIPGRYKATFRLKVDDNTVDQPVFQLSTGRSGGPAGVGPLLSESKTLKGTDFAQPNTYQNFTVEFDYADWGFMSVCASYVGNAKGWWDCLVLELVRPWTDQELADHYKDFKRPDGLVHTEKPALNILAVRGLYNRLYKIDEAAAWLVGAKITDTYTSYHQQAGTVLSGYKWDWKPLWEQDVIVLANVETKGLNYGQVLMLAEWVKDGGGLVILGGNLTLGQDENMTRGWPLFLPVTLNAPWEIRKCTPAVKIAGTDPKKPAVVLYRHLVTPKKDANIIMKGTKGEPLLVGGQYGKGRVVVFTGTVLGDAPTGTRAFWETAEWVTGLSGAMQWAAGE